MDDWVFALTFGPDGSLYAGGWFSTAGGVPASRIARWDGSQWQPLGGGLGGGVAALAIGPDGSLYAGGQFAMAGGVVTSGVARWDGAAWHPLGGGVAGEVLSLAVGPRNMLYAGGAFTTAGGVVANYIARWDGSQWHPLGSGMQGNYGPPYVLAMAPGPDGSLYVGGKFITAGGKPSSYIAQWTGAAAQTPVAWFPIALIDG
jgi:hypothetical protein